MKYLSSFQVIIAPNQSTTGSFVDPSSPEHFLAFQNDGLGNWADLSSQTLSMVISTQTYASPQVSRSGKLEESRACIIIPCFSHAPLCPSLRYALLGIPLTLVLYFLGSFPYGKEYPIIGIYSTTSQLIIMSPKIA